MHEQVKLFNKTLLNVFPNVIPNKIILCHDKEKQPYSGVPRKRYSKNMQQIYSRTPMPKSDFNKFTLQLYWNQISAWMFSCKFADISEHLFPRAPLDGCFWIKFFLEWIAKSKLRLRGKIDYFSVKESLGILTMLVSILLHKIYQMQATHQN